MSGYGVLGIITVFLTVYVLIYYAYLHRHSERDVSFFLSVSIIMLIMNLLTNGSVDVLSFLYLAIAVIFIGVGFAVDTRETLNFYTSIGPWFKAVFTDTKTIGWQILSFCFPAGAALYFVWYKDKKEVALKCGRCAVWGFLCIVLLLWLILGIVL